MGKTSYVLDSGIKGFFDHLDHKWIIKFVESRIKDPNIIRLVRVMLNAGVMDDGAFIPTDEGSGQSGSVRRFSQTYTCIMCWCTGTGNALRSI